MKNKVINSALVFVLVIIHLFIVMNINSIQAKLNTPFSGGNDQEIIIKEYGLIQYPDMDYESLFSKYSTLGQSCTDGDDSICGKGMVCRMGSYNTDYKRCFFKACNSNNRPQRPVSGCINLQQVIWEDAVVADISNTTDYLSSTNLYRNKWSIPQSNQKSIYKLHFLNSLPPSPAESYQFYAEKDLPCNNFKDTASCNDNKTCSFDTGQGLCLSKLCPAGDCLNQSISCGADCVCDSEVKPEKTLYYCNLAENSGLLTDNFCLNANINICNGGRAVTCETDTECLLFSGCTHCSNNVCVSENNKNTYCKSLEDDWSDYIGKNIGNDVSFTDESYLDKYISLKVKNSDYAVFFRKNVPPILKTIQSSPNQNIIYILARLKQITWIKKAWEQWYALCKTPQKINPNLVLTSEGSWSSDKKETELRNYQKWTGGNLQINCITTNPVTEIGTVFLQQSKNLNLPGILDLTKKELFNNKDINRLPSRGWYDAESIFQYYLSRCDLEKSALSNTLNCLETAVNSARDTDIINYCRFCSSDLFPNSCSLKKISLKDNFIIEHDKIKQQVPGYKKIDLCINPTSLTHIPSNPLINSDAVINVTPQTLPLIINDSEVATTCDPNKDSMCIVCSDCSNKNCSLGYRLVENNQKWDCKPIPPPSSNRKLIFKYLLNWGG